MGQQKTTFKKKKKNPPTVHSVYGVRLLVEEEADAYSPCKHDGDDGRNHKTLRERDTLTDGI